MSGQLAFGFDLDTHALATNLHRLADAIDEGEVLVEEVSDGMAVESTDAAEGTLELTYLVETQHSDLLNMVPNDAWDTAEDEQ